MSTLDKLDNCIFCKIAQGLIPSRKVYEDDEIFAFDDILLLAPQLALAQGCRPYPEGGFRILTNTGAEGGQEVQHLHIHVMGGPRPWLKR